MICQYNRQCQITRWTTFDDERRHVSDFATTTRNFLPGDPARLYLVDFTPLGATEVVKCKGPITKYKIWEVLKKVGSQNCESKCI